LGLPSVPSSDSGQPDVLKVFTKKMSKASYLLATFNEPLTEEGVGALPAHVIEEPVEEIANARDLYQNVQHMVRSQNRDMFRDNREREEQLRLINLRNEEYVKKANSIKEQRPVFVFEELTQEGEPIKYYGYKDKFMSANEQTKLPNYALMIFDVSQVQP
jgi:hypothetical protein